MTQKLFALDEVGGVTDQELITRLQRLVRADQTLNARLIVYLGEVDARGLYRERAYPSMFAYCVQELRMSESQAYLRIQAARLGREFPRIVELLAQGRLHLTAIKLLGPHLTAGNHVQLLERASGKGKRAIELLVAEIAPKPDVPSRMRKLPEPIAPSARLEAHSGACAKLQQTPTVPSQPLDSNRQALTVASTADCAPSLPIAMVQASVEAAPATFALEALRPRASSRPLSPGRYKLELTAGQALHDKLEQLQELLRHQVPDGDLAAIVERAVDLLIDHTLKQRFARTQTPRQPRSVARRNRSRNRYIPRAVVREVHQRDAGQCTFTSADGKRCAERGFLELHHVIPYARGGKTTPGNLRLVCRVHNALLAERDYGRDFMRSKRPLGHATLQDRGGSNSAQTE